MAGTPPTYPRPSVADVAALLRARTKDSEGREVGTFNDDTRPNESDVESHIDAAVGLVGVRFPAGIPDSFGVAFTTLVGYRAAMRIEKSYFPEQVRTDRSPYEQLRQEYLDDLAALTEAMTALGDDGGYGAPGHRAHSERTPTFMSAYGGHLGFPWDQELAPDVWPEPENPENWAQPLQPPREPPEPGDLPVGDKPASGTP